MISGLLLIFYLLVIGLGVEFLPGRAQYLTAGLIALSLAITGHFLNWPWLFPSLGIASLALIFLFYGRALRDLRFFTRPWQLIFLCTACYGLLHLLPLRLAISLASLLTLTFLCLCLEKISPWPLALYALQLALFYQIKSERLFIALLITSFALVYSLTSLVRQVLVRRSQAELSQALSAYAEEVQASHLQMRAWRHDFHNHLQSMRFFLQNGRERELEHYLRELESDLSSIDSMVKSGHLSLDAILNSKLTLAKASDIALDITVFPLPQLAISDVDLTALVGNLLDNAIEANEKIPKEQRFIRLYLDCLGEQMYLSIQNAAKEDLSFDERHYISNKRGRHGLGMKRVALLVEKYDGILNLKNEAGIFAVELSFALPEGEREGSPPSLDHSRLGEDHSRPI